MSFLTIAPDNSELYPNPVPIRLHVIDSPQVTKEYKRNKYKTYHDNGKSGYVYFNSGNAGTCFKVKVMFRRSDTWTNKNDTHSVFHYLVEFYTNNIHVSVVTETGGIINDIYTISSFGEYEIIRKDYYEVELEFTKYVRITHKLLYKCTVLQSKLKQCKKPSGKVYTVNQIKKNKAKASTCIGLVNQVLYSKGYLSKKHYKAYTNYWTKHSKKALIKFQKKWNKKGLKPKVNEKGKLSKKCWTALKRYTEL